MPLPRGAAATGELLVVGSRRTARQTRLDPVVLFNLTLESPSFHGMRLAATLFNLFDDRWDVAAGGEHLQDSILQDGRTFRVQLRYSF